MKRTLSALLVLTFALGVGEGALQAEEGMWSLDNPPLAQLRENYGFTRVGIVFAGNFESLPGTFIYSDKTKRAVAVHDAVMCEALQKLYKPGSLADEPLSEKSGIGGPHGVTSPDAALQHFQQNVAAYLALRDRVTAALPEPAVVLDSAAVQRRTRSVARAIQIDRGHPRHGDVFTADVAHEFRRVISLALRQHAIRSADVLADVKEELDEGRASGQRPTTGINRNFAWVRAQRCPLRSWRCSLLSRRYWSTGW